MSDPSEHSKSLCTGKNPEKTSSRYGYSSRSAFAQVIATLIQSWLILENGLLFGAPTLILGALHGNSSAEGLRMNDDEASWFGAIPSICTPLASFASGYLQDRFGRKGVALLANIPILATWLLLYTANSIPALYIGAGMMGLSQGLAEAPIISYTGEISEPHLRGILSTITSTAVMIGMIIMFVLGYYFDWRTATLISAAFPIITIAVMTQIPESPTWLLGKNRLDDAKRSLCWLRGWISNEEIEEEFQNLVNYTRNSAKEDCSATSNGHVQDSCNVKSDGFLKTHYNILTRKHVLRPLRLVMLTAFFTFVAVLVGMRPYYINELKALNSPLDPKLLLIIGQFLFIGGAVTNMAVLRMTGKRILVLFSYLTAAISILGLAAYSTFLKDSATWITWIPIVLLCVISFLSGLSILILPWQLSGEVYPPVGRGLATGISAAWTHLVISALIKSYLYMKAWVGFSGVMYLHCACVVIGFVYLYCNLPETEGKSLEQIETYFTKNVSRREKFSISKATNKSKSLRGDQRL
ncbi:unnamed protein product [Bemisia tabaci]|uniref:Major facilitator superfamily (MFS) profile domain-containing protein n=1 Tax=Bemisia tabaci TaxID=7038 RepID=A0A9P0EZ74_BEMTA|nr:unnamed protein product [Bemisia tabaci]